MKVLVADDDRVARGVLVHLLDSWGYTPVPVHDGLEAWTVLSSPDPPLLVLLDWNMPGIEGVDICRKLRNLPQGGIFHVILVTSRESADDLVQGLAAGANDYVRKPFPHAELRARLDVGRRMVELQQSLANRVRELEEANRRIRTLEGFLPICSYCKKVRDDKNYWQQIEQYISSRSDLHFTHSVCEDCYKKHVLPQFKDLEEELGGGDETPDDEKAGPRGRGRPK